MSSLQFIVPLVGLAVAAFGSAILNDWRGAALAWDRFDSRFPEVYRTPAPYAGISLFALGATMSLLPLLA